MINDPRVQQLIEELLASDATPEAVCASNPELLAIVRKQWQRLRRLRVDLDSLFPTREEGPSAPGPPDLPKVPGYEIDAVLGRGGMGIVFRAQHTRLGRAVALKMMLAGALAGPREKARFQREAEAAAGLRHPNVVQIYDVGDAGGQQYFTMEFVDGGSLAQKLAGAPMPARQAAELVVTLAGAVQAAHERGIVHRDLKPSNVLLALDGTPKISDFGLAHRQEDGPSLTQTGVALGTPSYMAPEQAGGRMDAVGPATDIYALGAILYELLTGRPPFRAASAAETVQQVIGQEPAPPSRLNDQVPRDQETICLKCLEKEPSRRYGTATELAGDLLRFLQGEPILARRAGLIERLVKWTRRNRLLAASLVGGMLLLNVLVAGLLWILLHRAALNESVRGDFREVVEAERKQAWGTARIALERAKARLGEGGPPELQQRVSALERELAFVEKSDQIRDSRQRLDAITTDDAQIASNYEQAFRDAGLLLSEETAAAVADRIRSSAIAEITLVALDDWRMCDPARNPWLSKVAQLVDQNPMTREMRGPTVWDNKVALAECLRTVQIENQSPDFLALAGMHLADLHEDALPFLRRLQQQYPQDYWVNSTLALVLYTQSDSTEAVRYSQAALATRPTSHLAHCKLAASLAAANRLEEGLNEARIAYQLAPTVAVNQMFVGHILTSLHRPEEGLPFMIRACEMDPNQASWHSCIGIAYAEQNLHEEALPHFRRAISIDPKWWSAQEKLRESLQKLNRWEESRLVWRQLLDLNPTDHVAWDGYADLCLFLGNEGEYRRTRTELLERFGKTTDPQVAERTGRSCLLLPASEDELRQATILIDRALDSERAQPGWLLPYFHFAKALAEYRAGRLESALSLLDERTLRILQPAPRLLLAMVQHRLGKTEAARDNFRAAVASAAWDAKLATNREAWMCHVLRREAEAVLGLRR